MTSSIDARAMGTAAIRAEGPAKVTGTAPYAYEHPVPEPLYVQPVQAPFARGRIDAIRVSTALAVTGVVAVLTHENAARLADTDDRELAVLQSPEVAFRGQIVGAVIASGLEAARYAAGLVELTYEETPHDVELAADRADLYAPAKVNGAFPTDTVEGDVESALAVAEVGLDATYTTPAEFNNPMEPHSTIAVWNDDGLTLYDSTQGVHPVRSALAPVFGLDVDRIRVISPHVGGGFGSKGTAHAHLVLAGLAAKEVMGRPVKIALTRQQMFCLAGHRTPTIQRMRLGAGSDGRLTAIVHDAVSHTSRVKEFAEQTAVITRNLYAAPNRRTSHRLAALDVPVPSWMRAPGECPGSFALECAMDEMAIRCSLDPVEFRIRNEPDVDPETKLPFSSRGLVDCLRDGARRFGWDGRDALPGVRRDGNRLLGTGVAASTYPASRAPGSRARIRVGADSRYHVGIGAADLGTGAWTVLTQIAADALGVAPDAIDLGIGDSALPPASVAGGSSGTASWGSTIVEAARVFRERFGDRPEPGDEAEAGTPSNPEADRYAMHAYGAQFAEVSVDTDTGEVRVLRMLGVFDAGRIINPRLARSQFLGGMTMGLSMALFEEGVMDPRTGSVVNHDLAEYHVATCADVPSMEAYWLGEPDPRLNPMGSKGIGEIGIVGSAAAVANAVYHATGVRVRDLPITPDKLAAVTGS